jgi:hypothetical protein
MQYHFRRILTSIIGSCPRSTQTCSIINHSLALAAHLDIHSIEDNFGLTPWGTAPGANQRERNVAPILIWGAASMKK